jgi:hypothetical protein
MSRAILALPLLLAPLLLAACGGSWPSGTYVRSVSEADAPVLAEAVADCLSDTIPSRQDVKPAASSGDPIAPLLDPYLARVGFTVASTGLPVSYVVTPLDDGVLLRISVDNREGATRFFKRSANGVLAAAGPTTVSTQ